MRLLRVDENGEFSLTDNLTHNIPPYAILSHTWGKDHEEVDFEDLSAVSRKTKPGYGKLRFCAQQAARDGLHHFWVDTCCTIQSHHWRQCPTKRLAAAAENNGSCHLALVTKYS
ncbi:hypothetical protein M433DRAFT_138045 [Acidomyces richmondensis BFW]|nr:hypothetical protein M433DRAFT_138045 [Acidomyces richmondensis BFW]